MKFNGHPYFGPDDTDTHPEEVLTLLIGYEKYRQQVEDHGSELPLNHMNLPKPSRK